jgi:hypothetical protein
VTVLVKEDNDAETEPDISDNDRLEVKDEVTSVLNESVNNIEIVTVILLR